MMICRTRFFGLLLLLVAAVPAWGQDYRVVNRKGHVVKQIVERQIYTSGNDLNRQTTYVYDQQGVIDHIEKQGGLSQQPMIEQVERSGYPPTGVSKGTQEHHFDGTVDSVFSLEQKTLVRMDVYDGDRDLVESHSYNADGQVWFSRFVVYRKTEVPLYSKEYYYQQGRMTIRKEYRYDRRGNLTQMLQFSMSEGDFLVLQERYSYDKRGNVSKRVKTHFNPDDGSERNTTETYKYTYDAQGNWTQKDYYYEGRHLSTTTRSIVYW